MTRHELISLLALLAEHVDSRALLARTLLESRDPTAVACSENWRPSPRSWHIAERNHHVLEALGITCLAAFELSWRLTRPNPKPPALFVRGDVSLLARPAIAIVGSRRASAGPKRWAALQAETLSAAGWLVVSGGARGIDGVAHSGALQAGATTVVYLGVAADHVYPSSNRRLFERILEHGGALVSEHPPYAATQAWCHAARNRLIAAHASHVLVAEAGEHSGSLGTAEFARRLQAPVWVPPPGIEGDRRGITRLVEAGWAHILPAGAALPLPANT